MSLRLLAATAAVLIAPVAAHAAASPGVAANGEAIFKQRCGVCHAVVDNAGPKPGPLLKGVVGRPAASVAGFSYSPALKASKLNWSTATLDRFLTAPAALVPGTFMAISLPVPAERNDLIAYLSTLSAPSR